MAESLYAALTESRALALNHGDYAGTIREHEIIMKAATKLARTAIGEEGHRLDALADQVRAELDGLQDLVAELSQLTSRGLDGQGGRRATGADGGREIPQEDDPDIWPPPTPEVGGGGRLSNQRAAAADNPSADRNMPAWARARDAADRRQSGGGAAAVVRRPAPEVPARRAPVEAARMRSERDNSVPLNRKR